MPELPEVETIVRQLARHVAGKKILATDIRLPKLIAFLSVRAFVRGVRTRRIITVTRRAKYLVFRLSGNSFWITHLRMTGKFVTNSADSDETRHVRARFVLSGGTTLDFVDQRTFGRMWLVPLARLDAFFAHLGVEPLTNAFNGEYLANVAARRTTPVKPFLLDQRKIAGIGNIYASEALFNARICPRRPAGKLSCSERERLVKCIKQILRKAIRYNGTTIISYRPVDKKTGQFQNMLKVYGRDNEPCPVCKKPIRRIIQGQRSTFYCDSCQT
jgi:formamidopyrimidine-DNA glycosylase